VVAPVVVAPAAVAPAAVAPAPADPAPAPTPAPAVAVAAAPAPGPAYVGDGFVSPRLADRACIASNLRLPVQLEDDAPEVVTVRVAVDATGVPAQVRPTGDAIDPRNFDAIRRAVIACEWTPGKDAQGKPSLIWVVVPIRLAR
jgi:hypothetical protein